MSYSPITVKLKWCIVLSLNSYFFSTSNIFYTSIILPASYIIYVKEFTVLYVCIIPLPSLYFLCISLLLSGFPPMRLSIKTYHLWCVLCSTFTGYILTHTYKWNKFKYSIFSRCNYTYIYSLYLSSYLKRNKLLDVFVYSIY